MQRMKHRGFSLIELLIVIAIVTTITGGTMLAFGPPADQAVAATRAQNRHAIRQAIDGFKADLDRYPTSLDELVSERYLREVPVDPATGSSATWVVVPSQPGRSDVWDVRFPHGEGGAR